VNALEIRNNLGRVLDELEESKQPVLVSKGRRIRVVLISPEDFKLRFIDRQAEAEKELWLKKLVELRAPRRGELASIDVLRELRAMANEIRRRRFCRAALVYRRGSERAGRCRSSEDHRGAGGVRGSRVVRV
jgi:PHD/YefM family antitoxin component YafN of YafNO toxin-antitoxin module